jgi:parallel beta helix pectate lyase-like protein
MKKATLLYMGLAFLVCIGCSPSSFAGGWNTTTLKVGQASASCPNPQYSTINAAVAAASAGDEIDICPALYPEQLIITKPLTLVGLQVDGSQRVLIQPPSLTTVNSLGFVAVITVLNTSNVTLENLAVDASKNAVSGCSPGLAAIHFRDASGVVENSAIFGAQLTTATGCASGLPFGNGFGVQVDADESGPFAVLVKGNSIHDFTANGVLVEGAKIKGDVEGNVISGVGPSQGVFQFGVFIANGAVGLVKNNLITEGNCGSLSVSDCIGVRSEGVTLRAVGDGTVVDHNTISKAQSGIFANGATHLQITNNSISNIDALSGMDIQGTASGALNNSVIENNTISHVGPIDADASNNEEGCGINEYSGSGVSGNSILNNTINDAYCGIAFVTGEQVQGNVYLNTLYTRLNSDSYPTAFPPATEP